MIEMSLDRAMFAAKLESRATQIAALYRDHRTDLSPVMHEWIKSFEQAVEEVDRIREIPDILTRGTNYLNLLCVLLAIGEHTATNITAVELADAGARMELTKAALS